MATIRDFKYKLIKNFFSKKELDLLQQYCLLRLDEKWQVEPNNPVASNLTPCFYNDSLMRYFHELKRGFIEKHVNLKLLKSYTYWRYYVYGSKLTKHTDRPSCEISVTASIQQSKEWPIQMNKEWITMNEGDAVVYMGCDIPHGRGTFKHDANAQVFFHYVDQDGPFTHHQNDQPIKDAY
tara:strand:- start:197 stop:736 length:540 start_codon:yes stop_codon:yes gene_type:complete